MDPLVLTAAGVVVALAGLATFLLVKVWPALRKFSWFLDDVIGEPARPGVPARPGISERLAALEATSRHHVQNDHSTNLRDDVDGIREQLDAHIEASAPQLKMLETLYNEWAGKKSRPLHPTNNQRGGKNE